MKCENCGRNEANFIYRSSINGRTEEHHLCQACAEKLGYIQRFFSKRPSMLGSFFGNDAFFGSTPSLMGRMLESPFDDFFDTMPAIGAAPVQEVQDEKKDNLMSHEDQNRFSYSVLNDVPVNQHFPGIRAEVAGAELVHLVANYAQFLLIQADFLADGSCAVWHIKEFLSLYNGHF